MSSENFWAKVFFSEFVRHFIEMNDEEIVADIRESILSLIKLKTDNNSFGAMIVKSADTRRKAKATLASQSNGKKGGRPPKIPPHPQDGVQEGVLDLDPPDTMELYDFCFANSIPEDVGREWFEMCKDRNWCFRDGSKIHNWKGALKNFAKAKEEK